MEPLEGNISTWVRFSLMLSEEHEPKAILPLLSKAAVAHHVADAAMVLQVNEAGNLQVAGMSNLPSEGSPEPLSADMIGSELEKHLLSAYPQAFVDVRAVPLVSSANLYGVLVLFFREPDQLVGSRQMMARGLANLGAVALDQAFHRMTLERSVTELRSTRDLLAGTERLRALGEMSASIAHDLRNIFSPMSLLFDLLEREANDPRLVRELTVELKQALKRGVETVDRLRLFGHQSREVSTERADLDVLVAEAVKLCRPRLSASGGVRLEVVPGGPVWAQVRGVEVVTGLMNLIVNAHEAMPGGGTITVRTGTCEQGGWLQVADTGTGLPPEVKQHLFEPFFTTKGEKGTGLGLAMVDMFVRRSGGTITVDSEPGRGTAFTLRFPRPA